MKSLDVKANRYTEMAFQLVEASKQDDEAVLQQAFVGFANTIQQQVLDEAEAMAGINDSNVLLARGVRQLTSGEKKYYQRVIDAMHSANPKQELANIGEVLPKTVYEDVFKDLETEHPLLSEIDFQNTGPVVEWIFNMHADQLATWSPLCAKIVTEITSGFKKVDIRQNKLSAFMPVCKAMLDLGPIWLDTYVRTVLYEALRLGIEDGIINGSGLNMPIGMKKDIAGAIDQTTGYPDKTAVPFTSFDPVAYGELLADMAKYEKGKTDKGDTITGTRQITSVVLIVNPVDYLKKVFPATTVRRPDGSYNNDIFPFPTKVVQSICMKEGQAILYLPGRYFFAIGTGLDGKIEHSDDYHFLEDERVYLIKFYGNGMPKDNSACVLLDITDLKPMIYEVRVVNANGGEALLEA